MDFPPVGTLADASVNLQFILKEVNWWENTVGVQSNIGSDAFSGRTVKTSAFISHSQITHSTSLEFRHGFNKEPLEAFALDMAETQDLNISATPILTHSSILLF